MVGEILQNLTITSKTHKEPAKIAPIKRKQIQDRQIQAMTWLLTSIFL